jgi:GNAT superfamily N-acetyltransferase
MRAQRIESPRLKFRLGRPEDVRPLLERFGQAFFDEAGFGEFTQLDIPCAEDAMSRQIHQNATVFVFAEIDGEVVGLISYSMGRYFTAQPIATLWMFYVMPAYRRSKLGRLLLWFALDLAKTDGACAFFATIFPNSRLGRSLCNLLRHGGFAPMGGALYRSL